MIDADLLRVAVIAPSVSRLDSLSRAVSALANLDVAVSETGRASAATLAQSQRPVDVVVLDCDLESSNEIDEISRLTAGNPKLDVVLFSEFQSAENLRAALRCGVREFVSPSEGSAELSGAFDRIRARRRVARGYRGQLLAFMSCKGGSGATFIAANFGYTLAAQTGKRVLLIDLNLQFGDAILYLSDRRPVSSVVDVVKDIERLDTALLKSAMTEILPNYSVLAAPSDPALAGDVNATAVSALLEFALTQADYVIVDLGRILDAPTIQALDRADFVHPVLQQTLPYIRDGRRMLDVFRSLGYASEKIRPILSRFDRSADVTVSDLEDALGVRIFASVANDFKVASASVNQGIPVGQMARSSTLARSFSDFASLIDEASVQTRPSWINRVLKRGTPKV